MARSLVLLALLPCAALAHTAGVTGYSGANSGIICNSCHSGGALPTVTLTGPTALMVASSATYTLTITGGAATGAGLDVSQAGGATLIAGTGSQVESNELTHSAPLPFSGGSAVFSFTVTAPASPGTVTLFAAGLSSNGNNTDVGDNGAATTLNIMVTATNPNPQPVDAGMPAPAPTPAPMPMSHAPQALDGEGIVDGGCSASGALPQVALLLIGALFAKRRRRPLRS